LLSDALIESSSTGVVLLPETASKLTIETNLAIQLATHDDLTNDFVTIAGSDGVTPKHFGFWLDASIPTAPILGVWTARFVIMLFVVYGFLFSFCVIVGRQNRELISCVV
jgi:hypothetical protein